MAKYALGLDYGTNSVRALLVDVSNGREIASSAWTYEHGKDGIILLREDPKFARQHPADYLKGAELTIKRTLGAAKRVVDNFSPNQIVGMGVDFTASTPLPVDRRGVPLAFSERFEENPDSLAWLWKDHTADAEAEEITNMARRNRPQFLAKCGGAYSCEWYFSKILHCLRHSPAVFNAAYTWVEAADWIPAVLTGTDTPEKIRIGVCQAGHKAMFNSEWGGYPDEKFLKQIDPRIGELRGRLPAKAQDISKSVGGICAEWADKTGLPAGMPVATGSIDAHMGAVGAGVEPGTMVQIIGTSACDMIVVPQDRALPDIPGVCGIVKDSILPGFTGIEAGQSAVGDIFNWFVECIQPGGKKVGSHQALTKDAAQLKPGESGLLALDWNNGNRNVLQDSRLSGLLVGQSLHTTPAEIYRTLVESAAFGLLTIITRLEQYNIRINNIVNCGGISEKNAMIMQIYADVTGRPMKISRSSQTCALGCAIAGAVVGGAYETFPQAQAKMTGLKIRDFEPKPEANQVYKQLFRLYRQLYDAFGTTAWKGNMGNIMKELIELRETVRKK
ncbi:MAG TPA: ribulokinase [Phycisphaerae bacterium]|nr:ribulokinase [Phycisphaerae bacterium]